MKNANKFGAFAAVAAAIVCACEVRAVTYKTVNGRFDVDKDYNVDEYISDIGTTQNSVVRQRGYNVHMGKGSGSIIRGGVGFSAAYILEDGTLTTPYEQAWLLEGNYFHFRQTGGWFLPDRFGFNRQASADTADTIPSDFVFSGNGISTNTFVLNERWKHEGDFNLVVMDNANIKVNFFGSNGEPYKKIVAVNGGELHLNLGEGGWKNTFFSFNGGIFMNTDIAWGKSKIFGTSGGDYTNVYARIYEKGANIVYIDSYYHQSTYGDLPALLEPEGNVVLNIALTDEVRAMEFDMPPAVVIKDSTNGGSNAVAIADYDFDTKAVTNIVIVCRGENYSGNPGDVTAELRYKATGDALATLVCETGPCLGGDVTIGGLKEKVVHNNRSVRYCYTLRSAHVTNTYHGATIIDADPDDECAGGNVAAGGWIEPNWSVRFPNSPRLVVKSGFLYVEGWYNGGMYPTIDEVFTGCRDLEMYNGFIGSYGAYRKYVEFDTVTIGGAAKLRRRPDDFTTTNTLDQDARIAVTNTLYVDVACMTNAVQITPAVIRGRIKFNTGSKVAVKNWKQVPRGHWQTILDLSDTIVNKNANGTGDASDVCVPEFEYIDGAEGDLYLKWEMNPDDLTKPIRLLARRPSDGIFLIFK